MKKKSEKKKKVVRKKKHEESCTCCQLHAQEFVPTIRRLVLEELQSLAVLMKNGKDYMTFLRLLDVALDRLLEIDERPPTIDRKKA